MTKSLTDRQSERFARQERAVMAVSTTDPSLTAAQVGAQVGLREGQVYDIWGRNGGKPKARVVVEATRVGRARAEALVPSLAAEDPRVGVSRRDYDSTAEFVEDADAALADLVGEWDGELVWVDEDGDDATETLAGGVDAVEETYDLDRGAAEADFAVVVAEDGNLDVGGYAFRPVGRAAYDLVGVFRYGMPATRGVPPLDQVDRLPHATAERLLSEWEHGSIDQPDHLYDTIADLVENPGEDTGVAIRRNRP